MSVQRVLMNISPALFSSQRMLMVWSFQSFPVSRPFSFRSISAEPTTSSVVTSSSRTVIMSLSRGFTMGRVYCSFQIGSLPTLSFTLVRFSISPSLILAKGSILPMASVSRVSLALTTCTSSKALFRLWENLRSTLRVPTTFSSRLAPFFRARLTLTWWTTFGEADSLAMGKFAKADFSLLSFSLTLICRLSEPLDLSRCTSFLNSTSVPLVLMVALVSPRDRTRQQSLLPAGLSAVRWRLFRVSLNNPSAISIIQFSKDLFQQIRQIPVKSHPRPKSYSCLFRLPLCRKGS